MKSMKKLFGSIVLTGVLLCSVSSAQVNAAAANGDQTTKFNTALASDIQDTQEAQEVSPSGYRSPGYHIPSIAEDAANSGKYPKVTASHLDPSYNASLANLTTTVKDQGPTGCCWAFAAMGASESSLISRGMTDTSVDLSENHLAYFNYAPAADPLGGTTGDNITLPAGSDYLQMGGNLYDSTISLANWVGVASESIAPFPTTYLPTPVNSALAYTSDTAHLQNTYWISMTDAAIVKQMIVEKGAGVVSFYAPTNTPFEYFTYYNENNSAFYYNAGTDSNHEVSIVGWDDNFSKANFSGSSGSGPTPMNNGAWLIKNSWGTSQGIAGYNWISYEDTSIMASDAAFYDYEAATNYVHNYQYDGTSNFIYSEDYANQVYMANAFTAASCEGVEAVSFYTASPNTNYSIQIYSGLAPQSIPTAGTKAFAVEQTGIATYAGYHTIKLTQPVTVSAGERFSVIIKLEKPNAIVPTVVDSSKYYSDGLSYTSFSSAGQSYFSSTGSSWEDVSSSGYINFRIKAFSNSRIPLDGAIVSDIPNQPFTGALIAPKVSVVKDGRLLTESVDYTLSYLNNTAIGTATVTIRAIGAYGGSIAKTFTIYQPVTNIATAPTVTISKVKDQTYTGKAKTPIISVMDGNYAMSLGYDYSVTYSKNTKVGTATITITGINKYTGVKSTTFKILPNKVKISKLKNSAAKTATITWKKVTGATGYQVYYSTKKSSGFKSAGKATSKLTLTKKKLKKSKKYYFKVRAYKLVNKKKVYGPYSSVKTVTIKK